MKLSDLKEAESARRNYEQASFWVEGLAKYFVTSATIGNTQDGEPPRPSSMDITLGRGCSGSGSINNIGFPDDLQLALTNALRAWAAHRLESAKAVLRDYGVDIAA